MPAMMGARPVAKAAHKRQQQPPRHPVASPCSHTQRRHSRVALGAVDGEESPEVRRHGWPGCVGF